MTTAIEAIPIIAVALLIGAHASVGNGACAGNASVNGVNIHGVSANGTAIAVATGTVIATGIVASIDSRFLTACNGRS